MGLGVDVLTAAFVITQVAYVLVVVSVLVLSVRRPTFVVTGSMYDRWLATHGMDDTDGQEARFDGETATSERGGPTGSAPRRENTTSAPSRRRGATAGNSVPTDGRGARRSDSGRTGSVATRDRCRLPTDRWKRIHVLVPVDNGLEPFVETLASIEDQRYPLTHVSVYAVYERGSEHANPSKADLTTEVATSSVDVRFTAVDRATSNLEPSSILSLLGRQTRCGRTPTSATDLDIDTQFESQTERLSSGWNEIDEQLVVAADDVVTVFPGHAHIPAKTFELANFGLDSYDVVATKRTGSNAHERPLTMCESMARAAWSDLIAGLPPVDPDCEFPVGYFTTVATLTDIERTAAVEGQTDHGSERFFTTNWSLGILDRYVGVRCPTTLEDWIGQKRRQLSEGGKERRRWRRPVQTRYRTTTDVARAVVLATPLVNLVGIPATLLIVLWIAFGEQSSLSPTVWPLLLVTGLGWGYASICAYRSAWRAIPVADERQRVRYFILTNPVTLLGFVTLWVVPVLSLGSERISRLVPARGRSKIE